MSEKVSFGTSSVSLLLYETSRSLFQTETTQNRKSMFGTAYLTVNYENCLSIASVKQSTDIRFSLAVSFQAI